MNPSAGKRLVRAVTAAVILATVIVMGPTSGHAQDQGEDPDRERCFVFDFSANGVTTHNLATLHGTHNVNVVISRYANWHRDDTYNFCRGPARCGGHTIPWTPENVLAIAGACTERSNICSRAPGTVSGVTGQLCVRGSNRYTLEDFPIQDPVPPPRCVSIAVDGTPTDGALRFADITRMVWRQASPVVSHDSSRAAEIEDVCADPVTCPNGVPAHLSDKTLTDWVECSPGVPCAHSETGTVSLCFRPWPS